MNGLLNTLSKDKWKMIGVRRRAGVLAPLFSLYSKSSAGIGDLADLRLAIDWCRLTGNSILQLLPMNETHSTFCPYDAVSSFALEPAYISLNSIPSAGKVSAKIDVLRKKFPAGGFTRVDYRIREEKLRLLWDMFLVSDDAKSEYFKKFVKENGYWLEDFALFKVLKNYHKGLAWYEWIPEYKNRDASSLGQFRKEHEAEIAFQEWVQWILFNQFRDAKNYASSKNVLMCGDLPILTSRDSADVWARPQFFKLEFSAGAPPDMYCAKGQRWGMPTYNWEAIAQDGYRYIKEKLRSAGNFYDILRIDHVVGLFRIWSIPYDDPYENEGLNGFFDPREEKDWEGHGRGLLSVILGSTDMLVSAEDLGMIPKACPDMLKEFGILGNDVQRWTKDWDKRHDFLKPDEYRLLAISMLSTHDTTNWPGWWENEAGTVDEALFIRKCADRGIDYEYVRPKLFNASRSKHGRLRWLGSVNPLRRNPRALARGMNADGSISASGRELRPLGRKGSTSVEAYVNILGKREEELRDFIELYQNTYFEKEKLWKHLGLEGRMREKSDPEIMAAALGITMKSRSVFCVNLLTDYLYLADIFKGDPYKYRVNRPGTVSKDNWSLVIPLPLEELLEHAVSKEIRAIISSAQRI